MEKRNRTDVKAAETEMVKMHEEGRARQELTDAMDWGRHWENFSPRRNLIIQSGK